MGIVEPTSPEDIKLVRELFQEYAAQLGVSLCFQGFSEELAGLPGAYARPQGRLLLAYIADQPSGCVALRPISETVCEMKRLYVRPAFRRAGLGRQLAVRIIEEARVSGYATMRLDTLKSLGPALRLYSGLGFQPIPAYYDTPLGETVFLELQLGR
jgi:GNAT superfamily N-acetyltransferase